jgi:hypothetical protein
MKISKEYLNLVIKEELETEMKGYEMAGEALDPEARRVLSIAGAGAIILASLVGNQFHNYYKGGGDLGAISRKITAQYANTAIEGTDKQYGEGEVQAAIQAAIKQAGGEAEFIKLDKAQRRELMLKALAK